MIGKYILSKNETKVIKAIRLNKFKELTITFGNGEKDWTLVGVETGTISSKDMQQLLRVLGKKEYKEFKFKTRNDEVVYFENKIKVQ